MLDKRIEETGISKEFPKYKKALNKISDFWKQRSKNNNDFNFCVKRDLVAYILKKDFIQFLHWNYDQDRIEDLHREIWSFITTGKMSNFYKSSCQWLNYNPNSRDTLIMTSRGFSKTSFFMSGWSIWEFYKNPVTKQLIISGTAERGKGAIQQIKKDLLRP